MVLEVVGREQPLDDVHALAQALRRDLLVHAEPVELVVEGAAADADLQPALGQDVGHADLAGEPQAGCSTA